MIQREIAKKYRELKATVVKAMQEIRALQETCLHPKKRRGRRSNWSCPACRKRWKDWST